MAARRYVSFSRFHIHPQGLRQPSVPLTSTEPTLEVATESWNPLKEKQGRAQVGPASLEVLIAESMLRLLGQKAHSPQHRCAPPKLCLGHGELKVQVHHLYVVGRANEKEARPWSCPPLPYQGGGGVCPSPTEANHVCSWSSLRPALYEEQECKGDRWGPFPGNLPEVTRDRSFS